MCLVHWYGVAWDKGIFTRNLNTFLFSSFIYKLTEVVVVGLRRSIRKWNASVLFPFRTQLRKLNTCFNHFCSRMTVMNDKSKSNMLPETKAKKIHFFFIKRADRMDKIHLFELNGHKFKLVATSCHSQTFIVLHISSYNKTYETYSDYYTAASWLLCLIPSNVQMNIFFFFVWKKKHTIECFVQNAIARTSHIV